MIMYFGWIRQNVTIAKFDASYGHLCEPIFIRNILLSKSQIKVEVELLEKKLKVKQRRLTTFVVNKPALNFILTFSADFIKNVRL